MANKKSKIVSFEDYNRQAEKENLKSIRRGFTKNSEIQQIPNNSKLVFNKVTKKMDNLTQDQVQDKIDALESANEGLFNFFAKKRTANFETPMGKGKAHFSGFNYDEEDIKSYIQQEMSEKGFSVKKQDIKILNVE